MRQMHRDSLPEPGGVGNAELPSARPGPAEKRSFPLQRHLSIEPMRMLLAMLLSNLLLAGETKKAPRPCYRPAPGARVLLKLE